MHSDEHPSGPIGLELLRRLRGLARARLAQGDTRLLLSPSPEPQEYLDLPEFMTREDAGLVLEPGLEAPFEIRPLRHRAGRVNIGGFCDGTRSTYCVGFEDVYPLMYTENVAAVRLRDSATGYHAAFHGIERGEATLLAPFGLIGQSAPAIRATYERLGLSPTRYADLCRVGSDDEVGLRPDQQRRLGSLAWQSRGQRRARWLMEVAEQIASLAASRLLREQFPDGRAWLMKDGSLFQIQKEYLRSARRGAQHIRQIVAVVKSHPMPFFGVPGERALAAMHVGERSVAFFPRRALDEPSTTERPDLDKSPRPMVCWYLRVRAPEPQSSNRLSGVVRLDIAATPDWRNWVDDVSWAVLDEFCGLSSRPDPRHDVLAYGIHECEQLLHARRLPVELLLATLTA